MLVAVALALAVAAALLLLAWRWESSDAGKAGKVVKHWPGPPSVPLFGISLKIKTKAAMVKQFMDKGAWYDQYGSPMRMSLGLMHGVHIFRPNQVEAILKSLKNTRKSQEYEFLGDWLGNGLLNSNGEKWFHRRKLLTPAFHFAILKDFMATFNKQAAILVTGDRTFDICPYITHATLDTICETAMGTSAQAQEKTDSVYVKAIQRFADEGNERTMRPWLWPDILFYGLFYSRGQRWRNILKTLHDFTNNVIEQKIRERREAKDSAEEEEQKPKRRVFMDLLLDLMDEGRLNRTDVSEEVDTFMFEGHDTTAHGIMWALYSLARNPDAQQRVRQEICDVLGERTEVGTEDVAQMQYLDCCVKESQRLWPSVPMILLGSFGDETYTVPKGTNVYVNFMACHRQGDFFPDPETFDPGQKFALLEMKVMLVNVIRRFEIRCDQKEDEMEPSFMLILRPENGIHLSLTPVAALPPFRD